MMGKMETMGLMAGMLMMGQPEPLRPKYAPKPYQSSLTKDKQAERKAKNKKAKASRKRNRK